jgi:type IV secretion system protein VirB11
LARVSAQDLCEATLRLRPDRILLGELRGKEAFTYLRTINSGHPGSITTIHSDSPRLAFEQLALMVMQADLGLTRPQIIDYVRHVVPIVIQLKRGEQGRRFVSEIYYRTQTALCLLLNLAVGPWARPRSPRTRCASLGRAARRSTHRAILR